MSLQIHAQSARISALDKFVIEDAMAVELSVMRKLFEGGALKAAIVAPAPLEKGAWVLIVERLDGQMEHMTVARSTRQKIYKTLESVSADAVRVGFREVRVQVA